jgi:hypothetical protein
MITTTSKSKASILKLAMALSLALIVGASISLYLAWPSLFTKSYDASLETECLCTYKQIDGSRLGEMLSRCFPSLTLSETGVSGNVHSADAIPVAECSSDAMMAGYKSAALTGLGAAVAAFTLMMLGMRRSARNRAAL